MASQDVQVWDCREMSAGAATCKDLTGLDVQDGALRWGAVDAGCWLAAQLGCRLEPLYVVSPTCCPPDGQTYMGTWLFPERTSGENQAEASWPF